MGVWGGWLWEGASGRLDSVYVSGGRGGCGRGMEGREVMSDHWNVGSLDGLCYKAAEGQ